MWNDFFYYSRSERRVICLLLVLLALLGGIAACLSWRHRQEETRVCYDAEADSFLLQVRTLEKKQRSETAVRCLSRKETSMPVVLQPFDPNVADSLQLRSLGIPGYVVRNILRYRAKGGTFRSEASFARIYGLDSALFLSLKPYLRFPDRSAAERRQTEISPKSEPLFPVKLPAGTVVELNKADTALLKQIPGIGSGRARMIVAYRERLGGYVQVSQLRELPFWADSLNVWFTCDVSSVRKIQVNRFGLDRLRNHPYMNFYKAKAILEYRRKRGKIKGLSQLSLFQEFTEKDLERLSPYLSFE